MCFLNHMVDARNPASQLTLAVNPIIDRVWYIPGPSTVGSPLARIHVRCHINFVWCNLKDSASMTWIRDMTQVHKTYSCTDTQDMHIILCIMYCCMECITLPFFLWELLRTSSHMISLWSSTSSGKCVPSAQHHKCNPHHHHHHHHHHHQDNKDNIHHSQLMQSYDKHG